jgi:hypothetical protein
VALLWPSEKGSFAGFGRENPKQGGGLFLFLVEIGKILRLFVPFF